MSGPERVLRVSGPTATVATGGGVVEARVPPALPGRPLVVGDLVDLRVAGDEPVLERIHPRATTIVRAAGPDGPPRVVVANADLLVVMESLTRPEPRPHLIDRYLVAAEVGGLDAAIVLTKDDLLDSPDRRAAAAELESLYRDIGYTVIRGSAKDPAVAERVRTLIGGRLAALAGQSGVGKSTLTRGLTGVTRAVGDVSRRVGTGRHTTSDPRLIPIPGGGGVVDTAGVRTFFLPRLEPRDIAAAFPELRAIEGRCRFRDCRHLGEAGCALGDAMAVTRRESYRALLDNP